MGNSLVAFDQGELAIALEAMELGTKPGGWVRLDVCTEEMPTQEMLDQVYADILATGHTITPPAATVINGVPTTSFALRRDLPYEQYLWPLIIGALVPLAIVGTVVYGITQIGNISDALIPILLVTGGILIAAIALLRKPAQTYIERGGKVPYLPSTIPIVANLPATRGPTPEYFKSNPPRTIEIEGRTYGIHMTMPTRMEADEEARGFRDHGDKTKVLPWQGGYAIYLFSPMTIENLPATVKFVTVLESGDTELTPGSLVSIAALEKTNERVKGLGLKPALAYETPVGAKIEDEGGSTFPEKGIIGFEPETVGTNVIDDLNKSFNEEIKAEADYRKRQISAELAGDQETGKLYKHIAHEEVVHAGEIHERIKALGGEVEWYSDTPEFLAETIKDSGWREKLDQAFQTAIQRVK